jgi:FtsP/CotA-like multicopper oxidase with cupredoxin domain
MRPISFVRLLIPTCLIAGIASVITPTPAMAQLQVQPAAKAAAEGQAPSRLPQPAHLMSVTTTPGPCPYDDIDIDKWGRKPFANPPEEHAKAGHLRTNVAVRYTDPKQISIAGCALTLRSYNGQLVGPTLRLKPGDTLDMLLDNQLPIESKAEVAAQFEQEASNAHIDTVPHSYNTTNLHTHGLHVSPEGISDNVLLAIAPQTKQPYAIHLPGDHTRGSYWYHAHAHGSTAIQVGSSMAGALIVEDDEAKIPASLKAANEHEKVFVFQSILYDTHGRIDDITAFFPDSASGIPDCKAGKSSCTWENSKRRTTINGLIVPVIHMRPGEVQRWRFIDATFRETLSLQLAGHALNEIATDGIYLGYLDTWSPAQSIVLQPGYRSDVLVQASTTPGTYKLIDAPTAASKSLRGVAEEENLLAEVVIDGAPLPMSLPTNQEMAPLAPFPGVDLSTTADGVQEAIFKLGSDLSPKDLRNYFQINYAAYNPSRIRYVQLNATEMWALDTVGDPFTTNAIPPLPHVFHIHVNPFQVARPGPSGQPETVWKDTVLVPAGTQVNIYTRYLDFTGKFVMHCHILDHEDLGMMEVVDVVRALPAVTMHETTAVAKPAATTAHQHP